ncbi:MAG: hypothetical protein AB7Q00_12635 [Phycisphaerales bacterium]
MHNQGQSMTFQEKAAVGLGLLAIVCRMLAVSVEPILHTRMGKHALGMPAFFATVAIPFWGILFPGDNLDALIWFWLVFLGGCVWNRVFSARVGEHTRYTGDSRLRVIFRRMDEATLKGVVEPLLVFISGVALYPVSRALGSYLMVACFGLTGSISLSMAALRSKVDQLSDARLEQEQLADAFRQLRGE